MARHSNKVGYHTAGMNLVCRQNIFSPLLMRSEYYFCIEISKEQNGNIDRIIPMSPIPHQLFIGIALNYTCPAEFGIYIHDGLWTYSSITQKFSNEPVCDDNNVCSEDDLHEQVVSYIKDFQIKHHCKIIMAGLVNNNENHLLEKLAEKLWSELDIIPCILVATGESMDERACSVARKTVNYLNPAQIPGLIKVHVGFKHEVEVDANGKIHIAGLDNYKNCTSTKTWNELVQICKQVKKLKRKIVFFNSTPQGGGVAIIRHSTIRLFKLLDVEAHWYVLKPNPEVFEITKKKFHNVLQGVAGEEIHLSHVDKEHWKQWCDMNVESYWSDKNGHVATADVIVIDDPQPSGMIPHLRKINPKAKLVYRSHIELRSDLIKDPSTEQANVWNFLWDNIKLCDIFVSHPVDKFIPENVLSSNIEIKRMPAITDPVDGLNKKLDSFSLNYYHLLFNRLSLDQTGKEMNFSCPYFIQVARFDPSKGIPDLIDAYIRFRLDSDIANCRLGIIPQLVLTGHGSIDDPEGITIYESVTKKVSRMPRKYDSIKRDIHIVRLGPSDQMLNAMLTSAQVAFQLSHREGFEIKVSEALLKGVPVVGNRAGGIPLQITDGVDGHLVTVGDIDKVAELMKRFTTDKEYLKQISENAAEKCRENVLTPMNVLHWAKMMIE